MTATFLWVLNVSVLKAKVFLPLRLFGCRQTSGLPSSNIVYHEKWIPGKETIIWITPSLLLALSDPLPDLISLVFLSRFGMYSAYSTERKGGCTFKWFSVAKSAVLHLALHWLRQPLMAVYVGQQKSFSLEKSFSVWFAHVNQFVSVDETILSRLFLFCFLPCEAVTHLQLEYSLER